MRADDPVRILNSSSTSNRLDEEKRRWNDDLSAGPSMRSSDDGGSAVPTEVISTTGLFTASTGSGRPTDSLSSTGGVLSDVGPDEIAGEISCRATAAREEQRVSRKTAPRLANFEEAALSVRSIGGFWKVLHESVKILCL